MWVGPLGGLRPPRQVLIVNAPAVFSAAWALVSPLLPARTRAKVSILGASASAPALLDLIDATELPAFLGGKRDEAGTMVARAEPVPRPP